ncbi:hypothetical protein [Ralstonia insidiosa]|jgi:hypothetical protein|nr:hypothetical protein [Ralstonia insidiosa]MBX3904985.1 hypothetical protein [Ralstonia insidiosa]
MESKNLAAINFASLAICVIGALKNEGWPLIALVCLAGVIAYMFAMNFCTFLEGLRSASNVADATGETRPKHSATIGRTDDGMR